VQGPATQALRFFYCEGRDGQLVVDRSRVVDASFFGRVEDPPKRGGQIPDGH